MLTEEQISEVESGVMEYIRHSPFYRESRAVIAQCFEMARQTAWRELEEKRVRDDLAARRAALARVEAVIVAHLFRECHE